jgi:Skp family chaperone for outer membrane proteins
MTSTLSRLSIPLACLMALTPVGAAAQAPQPAVVPAGLGGPVVPGICLLSREAVLTGSKVGINASEQVRQITAQAQAEVDALRKPVDAEIAAARAQAAKMPPDQVRAQEKALGAKLAQVQARAEQRRREIEKTRIDAIGVISAQAQPLIAAAYTQKGCGLLFERGTLLGGNFANDITAAVVNALDAKLTTIPIQRATLPATAKP